MFPRVLGVTDGWEPVDRSGRVQRALPLDRALRGTVLLQGPSPASGVPLVLLLLVVLRYFPLEIGCEWEKVVSDPRWPGRGGPRAAQPEVHPRNQTELDYGQQERTQVNVGCCNPSPPSPPPQTSFITLGWCKVFNPPVRSQSVFVFPHHPARKGESGRSRECE